MTLQYKVKRITQDIALFVQSLFDKKSKKTNYVIPMVTALAAIVLVTALYVGYQWYVTSREQKAQQLFSLYMQDFASQKASHDQEGLQRVERLFAEGHTQYRSSALAPYFLAMQAEVQLQQDKQDEALATLHMVVTSLPSSSPMLPLFKTKHALVALDSKDESIRNVGLQELMSVARDTHFAYNDMALFYLGRYYWSQNDLQEAKKIWQELVDLRSLDQAASPSPWAHEAQQALKQLTN